MKYFINLSNHSLSLEQKKDAEMCYDTKEFVELPEKLKKWWGSIPATPEAVTNYDEFDDLENFLEKFRGTSIPGIKGLAPQAVVMVAGVGSLCAAVAAICEKLSIVAVEATTERISVEVPQENGSVEIRKVFRHICFRDFPLLYWK